MNNTLLVTGSSVFIGSNLHRVQFKLWSTLGWKPKTDLQTGMQGTVEWYVSKWEQATL